MQKCIEKKISRINLNEALKQIKSNLKSIFKQDGLKKGLQVKLETVLQTHCEAGIGQACCCRFRNIHASGFCVVNFTVDVCCLADCITYTGCVCIELVRRQTSLFEFSRVISNSQVHISCHLVSQTNVID